MERVEWVDSGLSFASAWLDERVAVERVKEWNGIVVTVGHVVYEDEERILIGMSHDVETGNWAGLFGIYKPCIIKRTVLTEIAA